MTFHLVEQSPWPVLISLTLLTCILSPHLDSLAVLLLIVYQWFRDINREGKAGYHTVAVQKGLTLGYILFLVSEVMLFSGFFWAFFHSSLSPSIEIGVTWPPYGIDPVSYLSIPLLGSILLLASGFFITLSHHAFLEGSQKSYVLSTGLISIVLGSLFLVFQLIEYTYGSFTIADSVYGSVFYMTTGLHGLHVTIGLIFLIVQYVRIVFDNISLEHHLGLEFALFYYHLVDIVWLFLFLVYYWWGS